MIARSALELHPRARAVMATLLLVLVSLAVPLEASQPLHVHEAGTAGLYNEPGDARSGAELRHLEREVLVRDRRRRPQ